LPAPQGVHRRAPGAACTRGGRTLQRSAESAERSASRRPARSPEPAAYEPAVQPPIASACTGSDRLVLLVGIGRARVAQRPRTPAEVGRQQDTTSSTPTRPATCPLYARMTCATASPTGSPPRPTTTPTSAASATNHSATSLATPIHPSTSPPATSRTCSHCIPQQAGQPHTSRFALLALVLHRLDLLPGSAEHLVPKVAAQAGVAAWPGTDTQVGDAGGLVRGELPHRFESMQPVGGGVGGRWCDCPAGSSPAASPNA
jgi:hypothetical protein